jgi:acyl-CoA reductase-like NAD-dependent aldehyde dehydrogenase
MTATEESWSEKRKAVRFDVRAFVAGKREASNSETTVERVSPGDGAHLYRLPVGSQEDADRAVRAARVAFDGGSWSDAPPLMRKAILFGFADLIEKNQQELALLDCLEMGKPISMALGDVVATTYIIRYYAEYCDKITGEAAPTPQGVVQFNQREPRGVVAAIVPWNYPLPNAALKIAPALAAGNAVVLKPSELSSSSALKLAELAIQAGVPEGIFNAVPGMGSSVGASLAANPDVDFIAFTGSTATGRFLMKTIGSSHLKPLQLECGGKSANIVFGDFADLDAVAADAARRIFDNQGQLCVAGTRLIAHKSIKQELVERVRKAASALQAGDPLDPNTNYGPLASRARMEAVLASCEAGSKGGAKLVQGGKRVLPDSGGFFVEPTIFDNVTGQMPIAQDDIFGPVLSVMSFDTPEEAIALANGTIYGLSATVWTKDLATAHVTARKLKAGRVEIHAAPSNPAAFVFPMAAEPFGQSGFGAEAGREGFEAHTRLKAIEIHV